jgi:PKD repeat protein
VQYGAVCLLGLSCSSSNRNLLDFNGIDVDKEGRVLLGYTDGCLNCTNAQNTTQSSQAHGNILRQSGGRRLFSAFDPIEPAPPAAPQFLSVVRQDSNSVLLSWLEPDNGGSPITGYNIYRSDTSGAETFLAHVSGELTLKYLDQAAPNSTNWYYKVMAVNAIGESTYCHELNVNGTQAAETACQLPYLTMVTDPTSDQFQQPNANQQLDIQRVSIGEPFVSCTDKSITFVMKVQNLNPAPAPNGAWRVLFNVPDTSNTSRTIYVQMDTQLTPTPEFEYGYVDNTGASTTQFCPNTPGFTCPVSGSTSTDGTITIKLNVSSPLDFFSSTNTGTTPDFRVAFTPGAPLTALHGQTVLLVGAAQTGQLVEADSTTSNSYTLKGNFACLDIRPQAVLTANPMSGTPPLSVNFSGAASTDLNPCTSIVSYTLDFGDGTAPVTQSSSSFSHTYNTAGNYPARLTVTDSAGQVSDPSQVVISVQSSAIQLAGAVSRKVHGAVGPFDLTLPLDGPAAIEPRSGGPNNDYQVIFVFPNTLQAVADVTLSGAGSVASKMIGTDARQYIVNLSGITTGQHITVTLHNAQDTAGNAGDVAVTMGVLVGDTNSDHFVDSADIGQTKSQSGKPVTQSNYREDLNNDGFIDSADISLVKSKSGTALPAPAP